MRINQENFIRRFSLVALMTACMVAPSAVLAHADHGKPMYGGVVAEAGSFQGELVVKALTLTLHITIHGEPVVMDGGSAKAVVLSGNNKTEVTFTSVGSNSLAATVTSALPKGSKAVVTVKLPNGRSGALRFTLP